MGMQPAVALVFLALAIKPLMLARSSMSRGAWLVVVALTVILALVNATACVLYLWSAA